MRPYISSLHFNTKYYYIQDINSVNNINGDKMKVKNKGNKKYAFFALCGCAVIYLSLTVFLLPPQEQSASKSESKIEYENIEGELLIYAECEELNEYSAVYADFDMKTLNVFLFPNKETAKTYGLSYNRYLKYTKQTEIEFIGRIGGIVIDRNVCYNDNENKKERIFGNRVIELSTKDEVLREHIALKFLEALLSARVSKTDFLYIAENCETDISYADFYKYFDAVCSFKDNISVRVIL